MDTELAAVFTRQRGLITAAQAGVLGITPDGMRHRVRIGVWERLGPGLYRLRGTADSWEQRLVGVVLRAGELAWASHVTALTVWGYRGFADEPNEITVPLDRRPRIPGVRVHRSGTVVDADLRVVDGIPVLSAARTLVDVSARFDDAELGRMVDDGLRRRVVTLPELHAAARRLPTIAPGRSPKRVTRLLSVRTAGFHPGDSELESTVLRVLADGGLPEPVRQHRVVVDGRTYFLDLAYPEHRVAIEVDGFDFHRARGVFDRDRARQNDLVRAGWTVLRFTARSSAEEILTAVRPFVFGR